MRSHAKASSAGSTQGQGSRQGSFVRGALATRCFSSDADGSGAPSQRRVLALSFVAALLAMALLASPPAFASKQLLSDFGSFAESGSYGGDLNNPRDVAANGTGVGPADPGDVYVADENNNRVERFSSSGNFISAWGKDTIASAINERQKITLSEATAGTYTLSFDGVATESLSYNQGAGNIRFALAALSTVNGSGNVEVSGEGSEANPFIVTFRGALGGANQPTITADTTNLSGTISISTVVNGASSVAHDTGTGFEICTVAAECKVGVASGENGGLDHPQSVAIDEDTGNLYVSDRNNRRVDEYDGEGNFIRSFGFDVVESGPDDTGTGYEVCNEAEADSCKAGVGGAGAGQYGNGFAENGFGIAVSPADGSASTGKVYLADSGNRRVDTFNLDGSSPTSFGSSSDFGEEQPRAIAVDSRGIVYASDSNNNGDVLRYDSLDADGGGIGFLPPIVPPNNERQKISFGGFNTGDNYKLVCPDGTPTEELTYVGGESGQTIIKNGLEAACGAGNLSFAGQPPNVTVTFEGVLAASNQAQMACTVLSGSGSCSVTTTSEGHPGPLLTGFSSSTTAGLAVDSAGSVLYVLRDPSSGPTVVQQFGPGHEPGLATAPTAADDTHGAAAAFSSVRGFGLNRSSGRLYISATNSVGGLGFAHRVYVLDDFSALPDPSAAMSSGDVTSIADRSATFHGTVNPRGGLVGCKFQYSTDDVHWTDAGYAEGTGTTTPGWTTVTNVNTTSGTFYVGQKISGENLTESGTNTIVAVGAETLTLLHPAGGHHVNMAISGTPPFPPRCDALSQNAGSQNVSQKVGGLIPDTHYFVRLQVTRPYFSSFTPATSEVRQFTTISGSPVLSGVSASAVDEHSVRIAAAIDPGNSPTAYVVQYGTTPALGSSTAPVNVGGGPSVEVTPIIAGLSPATQYYFKLIATNLAGSAASEGLAVATFASPPSFGSCANDRFRVGPSAKLPDCRAYEQVTPTDKYGSDAYGDVYSVQSSNAGDGITFHTFANFPGAEGFQNINVFLSRFVDGKWSTAGLNPPPSYGDNSLPIAWTPDLNLSFAKARSSAGLRAFGLTMRDSTDGSFSLIFGQGVGFNPQFIGPVLGGTFDSESKVVFQANGDLPVTSGPAPSTTELNAYLYDRDTGELELVGLLPDSACGVPPCVPEEGSELPAAFQNYLQEGHAVSPDGGVYFVDRGTGQLYLRRDVAGPSASTIQVSASARTDCADHDPCSGTLEPDPAGTFRPTFLGATPDGSRAFFKSRQKLTDDSTATANAEDLYSFDADAPAGQRLTDLAPGAKVVGMFGYSDGGDYVYFSANGDLDGAGPAGSGDCAGQLSEVFYDIKGSCSLYLWQADGVGACASARGCVTFIARLNGDRGDGYDWAGGESDGGMKASRNTADGRILVFRSANRLTAYDSQGTTEFYRYEADNGHITCITCNPTGAPPVGAPDLKNPDMYHAPSSHAVYGAQLFLSRNLSPDGSRFFFQSTDKLVPADVNGDVSCSITETAQLGAGPSCRDVYEWEAPGAPGGSCTKGGPAYSSANGGCIYLLSTGTGAYPSYLADVSESGDTAFIFSRQQLVPSDEDTQEDIYAVKVDGGLAYQHATRPAACEGDGCRGASSQPSGAPGAGTAVFEGPGNLKSNTNSTHCPKGKRTVHSKGRVRCVAKHPKKHHKGRRHHKRAANNDRRASR